MATASSPFISWLVELENFTLFQVGDTQVTLSSLLFFTVIMIITYLVSRVSQKALKKLISHHGDKLGLRKIGTMIRLVQYFIYMIGITIALQLIGIRLDRLLAAGAIFAVGLGFALQNIAQNFFAGIIMLLERSINPDDILEVDGQMVRVKKVGIRSTIARNLDDEDLIIPNADLVQNTVKNFTLSDRLCRVRVRVGVGYESDLRQVETILHQGLQPLHVEGFPQPTVHLVDFADSSIIFEASLWTKKPLSKQKLRSELLFIIWERFSKHHIVIAFPQLDLHLDQNVVHLLKAGSAEPLEAKK